MRRPSRLLLHPPGCAWAITFVVLIAGWTAVASANTVSGPRETVRFDYTTRQVNSATGLTFDLSIRNPTDPSAAPVPLRKIVLVSPAGVRSDAQIPSCTASDRQMEFSGESACPTASKLATGTSVTRPLGGLPFTSDTAIFKTPDGQAMLIKFGNGGSAVVHTTIQGRIATTEVPTCLTGGQPPSGCPIDEDAVVASNITYPASTSDSRVYLTTPPSCPASGSWQNVLSLTYADGVTDTVTTSQPCATASGRRGSPPAHRHSRRHHVRHRAASATNLFTGYRAGSAEAQRAGRLR